jgi:uncharacterized protein (TIRG00374 family)
MVAFGAGIAVGLGLIAQFDALWAAFLRFDWRLSPLIVGATLANYALRFQKWDFYLRRLEIPLPRRQSLLVFGAGFTMAITPGKLGELLKAVLVRDLVGTGASRTASVVVAERITDVVALVVLSAIGATALPYGEVILGTLGAALVAVIWSLRSPRLAAAVERHLAGTPRLSRFGEPLRLFLGAGRTLLTVGALAWTVALSTLSWLFECVALYLVLRALSIDMSVRTSAFVYAFASLAGAASMLPGGLGVAEGSLAGLLTAVGTPLPAAAAATLLIRAATLWLGVGLGLAALALLLRDRAASGTGA